MPEGAQVRFLTVDSRQEMPKLAGGISTVRGATEVAARDGNEAGGDCGHRPALLRTDTIDEPLCHAPK